MEKSLYVDTNTMRGIMFPNNRDLESPKLFHNDHVNDYLESLFHSKLSYFDHNKFTDEDDYAEQFSPIVVKLIITNPDRTGLWLVHEVDKQKVSIPGGHVSKDDVMFVREELENDSGALLILQEALSREIYEEFYGDRRGAAMYNNCKELLDVNAENGTFPLCGVESAVYSKFKTSYKIQPIEDLYYLYKGKGRQYSRSLAFYYVIECERRGLTYSDPVNFIWLDKEDFRLSCRKGCPKDMIPILGDPIVPMKRDIRYSLEYRPILEIIFNTSEIF